MGYYPYLYIVIYEENIDYGNKSLGELQEILEDLYENLPKDKRIKDYHIAKAWYNNIAQLYNTKAEDKIYTIIK